jgi:hypothetical protein
VDAPCEDAQRDEEDDARERDLSDEEAARHLVPSDQKLAAGASALRPRRRARNLAS